METDRGAVLTLRAAVTGAIDYSEARQLDPKWWRRHRIIIEAIAENDRLKTRQAIFEYHKAYASHASLSEESFDSVQKRVKDSLLALLDVLRPWDRDVENETISQQEISELEAAWFEAFDVDPNDPEWEKKEEAKIQEWLAAEAEKEEDSEEAQLERIRRKQAERDEKISQLRQRINELRTKGKDT